MLRFASKDSPEKPTIAVMKYIRTVAVEESGVTAILGVITVQLIYCHTV